MRDVARRAVRAEIAGKAMELFLAQGFEETTVSQVAAAVGMSGRSLFRYFDTKEDLAVVELVELGHDVAVVLESRPEGEDAWTALRQALQVCVVSLESGDEGLRRAQMFAATPALRTALLDKQLRWQRLLVPLTQRRLPESGGQGELRARALVSAALGCLDVAATAWTEADGKQSLTALTDVAFGALRPSSTPS
jgi:AcrR family transcriptional regulator